MSSNKTDSPKSSRREFIQHAGLLAGSVPAAMMSVSAAAKAVEPAAATTAGDLFSLAETTVGKIRGQRIEIEDLGVVHQFLGVPYGEPAAGRNRFRPPMPVRPWPGIRDAFAAGTRAPQIRSPSNDYLRSFDWDRPPGGMGEDCLNLNVWTPALGDGGKRPVMVCFHGGGLFEGTGNAGIISGERLAPFGDVVVVCPNHRLNSFGFLHLADLGAPDDYSTAGVNGVLDLVLALQWVRDNAAALGGDPGNVTIYGHSGGGLKTSILLAMPAAAGLFHKAIVQSGSGIRIASRDEATRVAEQLLGNAGLPKRRVAELADMPMEQLLMASRDTVTKRFLPFMAVADGRIIPSHPFDPGAPSISAQVPMMIGTSLDDAALFLLGDNGPFAASLRQCTLKEDELEQLVLGAYRNDAPSILKAYRDTYPDVSPFFRYARLLTDLGFFRQNAILQAERKAAQGGAPVWLYRYDRPSPAYGGRFGAIHGVEVEYSFNSSRSLFSGGSGSAECKAMANVVASTWVAFARLGNPNNATIPEWRPFTSDLRHTMLFDTKSRSAIDPDQNLRLLANRLNKQGHSVPR